MKETSLHLFLMINVLLQKNKYVHLYFTTAQGSFNRHFVDPS